MAKDINTPGDGHDPGNTTDKPQSRRSVGPVAKPRPRSLARSGKRASPAPEPDRDPAKALPQLSEELNWPAIPPRDSRIGRHEPIRRSGGPRTAEGRAVASRNALTHGAYAMPPSSSEEYGQHLVQTERYFNPTGPVESHLVQQIAQEIWRLDAIGRYERGAVSMLDASEPAAPLIARAVGFPYGPEHHHLLCRPDDLLLRSRLSWRLDDMGLSAGEGFGPLPELARVLRRPLPGPDIDAEEAIMRRVDDALLLARSGGALHARLAGSGGQELLAEYWVLRNHDAITRERWALVHARVLELLSNPALVRARQSSVATLLKLHDRLMLLQQTHPNGVPVHGSRRG
jgi:hypothetical protein